MKIESLKIKNYKVFKEICMENIPNFAVFLGKDVMMSQERIVDI